MDNELTPEWHTVDGAIAREGALFGSKMEEALRTYLGREPTIDEMRDFALGTIDIIFSATYGVVYHRENPETAHSWTEAVMKCVTDSVKAITNQDFKVTIVARNPAPS